MPDSPLTGRVKGWRHEQKFRFPSPATSNGACGFPALRFPVGFAPRVMRPIGLGVLSEGSSTGYRERHRGPGRYRASPYSTVSNRISLRLDVDPSPQVLQIYGRLYHVVPASRCGSGMPTVGHLGSPGITPVHSYYVPIRHPLVFDPLPGVTGYRIYLAPGISARDEEGFSSCLVCPCQRAVATTPPEGSIRRPVWDQSYCLHPTDAGSTSGATHFRGHLCIHFRYGPLTRSPPLRWLCRWASGDRFP